MGAGKSDGLVRRPTSAAFTDGGDWVVVETRVLVKLAVKNPVARRRMVMRFDPGEVTTVGRVR